MSHDTRMTEDARDRSAQGQRDVATPPEKKPHFELSLPRVMAGALAAASAAVAASWLGVAGTVTGAVVASIVFTVSSAVYTRPIERSSRVIRETLPVLPVLPERYRAMNAWTSASTETLVLSATDDLDKPIAVSQPDGLFTLDDVDMPDKLEELRVAPPAEVPAPKRERRPVSWGAMVASSALTLVAGFGILTGVEALLGEPISSLFGADTKGGTTITRIVDRPAQVAPTDSQPTTPTETTPTDGGQPTPTEPTPTEPTPTEPTPTEPTPTEPTPTEPTTSTSTTGASQPSTEAPVDGQDTAGAKSRTSTV